jgi:mannose-1-phosphate guanylyltransferase
VGEEEHYARRHIHNRSEVVAEPAVSEVVEAAVILVGGRGTRLGSLTDTLPKAMLPLAGRPLLAYLLDALRRAGVERAVLACGYRAEAIRDCFGTEADGLALEYVVEQRPLGTGGALRLAADGITSSFLAINGDQILDIDLSALVRFHVDRQAKATLLLKEVEDARRYGLVRTDDRGRVIRFAEKSFEKREPALVNAGVYVFEPGALATIPLGRPASLEEDVLPGLAREGSMFGLELPGYWLDVGTPESYERAERELLGQRPEG